MFEDWSHSLNPTYKKLARQLKFDRHDRLWRYNNIIYSNPIAPLNPMFENFPTSISTSSDSTKITTMGQMILESACNLWLDWLQRQLQYFIFRPTFWWHGFWRIEDIRWISLTRQKPVNWNLTELIIIYEAITILLLYSPVPPLNSLFEDFPYN